MRGAEEDAARFAVSLGEARGDVTTRAAGEVALRSALDGVDDRGMECVDDGREGGREGESHSLRFPVESFLPLTEYKSTCVGGGRGRSAA